MKATLISVAILITLLLVMVVWIARQPPAPAPKVFVRFLGYTNDASQQRVAMFNVTNAGRLGANRGSYYRVFLGIPGSPPRSRTVDAASGYLTNGSILLEPGGWERWSILPPTNPGPWYVGISVRTDEPPVRDMVDSILEAARSLGIRPRYRQHKYLVTSEKIE